MVEQFCPELVRLLESPPEKKKLKLKRDDLKMVLEQL